MTPGRRLILDSAKSLLLTFDAFGTLFEPRKPIAQLYAQAARKYGLGDIEEDEVEHHFRKAFKDARLNYPNYGKSKGLKPRQWWQNVILSTFSRIGRDRLPNGLKATLWRTFSSREGYRLCHGVEPFFQKLFELRRGTHGILAVRPTIVVGVITNSDDRVSPILKSLGMRVNDVQKRWQMGLAMPLVEADIDFVTTSYEVGHSKPARVIFDAAFESSGYSKEESVQCIHIGDQADEDAQGAMDAGWHSILLQSHQESIGTMKGSEDKFVRMSMGDLVAELEGWSSEVECS